MTLVASVIFSTITGNHATWIKNLKFILSLRVLKTFDRRRTRESSARSNHICRSRVSTRDVVVIACCWRTQRSAILHRTILCVAHVELVTDVTEWSNVVIVSLHKRVFVQHTRSTRRNSSTVQMSSERKFFRQNFSLYSYKMNCSRAIDCMLRAHQSSSCVC